MRIQCPNPKCDYQTNIGEDKAGRKATCPKCQAKFHVPYPAEAIANVDPVPVQDPIAAEVVGQLVTSRERRSVIVLAVVLVLISSVVAWHYWPRSRATPHDDGDVESTTQSDGRLALSYIEFREKSLATIPTRPGSGTRQTEAAQDLADKEYERRVEAAWWKLNVESTGLSVSWTGRLVDIVKEENDWIAYVEMDKDDDVGFGLKKAFSDVTFRASDSMIESVEREDTINFTGTIVDVSRGGFLSNLAYDSETKSFKVHLDNVKLLDSIDPEPKPTPELEPKREYRLSVDEVLNVVGEHSEHRNVPGSGVWICPGDAGITIAIKHDESGVTSVSVYNGANVSSELSFADRKKAVRDVALRIALLIEEELGLNPLEFAAFFDKYQEKTLPRAGGGIDITTSSSGPTASATFNIMMSVDATRKADQDAHKELAVKVDVATLMSRVNASTTLRAERQFELRKREGKHLAFVDGDTMFLVEVDGHDVPTTDDYGNFLVKSVAIKGINEGDSSIQNNQDVGEIAGRVIDALHDQGDGIGSFASWYEERLPNAVTESQYKDYESFYVDLSRQNGAPVVMLVINRLD